MLYMYVLGMAPLNTAFDLFVRLKMDHDGKLINQSIVIWAIVFQWYIVKVWLTISLSTVLPLYPLFKTDAYKHTYVMVFNLCFSITTHRNTFRQSPDSKSKRTTQSPSCSNTNNIVSTKGTREKESETCKNTESVNVANDSPSGSAGDQHKSVRESATHTWQTGNKNKNLWKGFSLP